MNTGETIALIKALCPGGGGGGGSSLPSVTSADNGKVLTVEDGAWAKGVQEYWIPVETSGGLSIPNDKQLEVSTAINAADRYWVRGVVIGDAYFTGYVCNSFEFTVPMSRSQMYDLFGIDCEGRIYISNADGSYNVTVEPNKCIVTLTPTAADFSGTMDKTPVEITAAYEAGQEIVFNVVGFPGFDHVYIPAAWYTYATDMPRCAACATLVDVTTGLQIVIVTSDGGSSTYETSIYTLTHAS